MPATAPPPSLLLLLPELLDVGVPVCLDDDDGSPVDVGENPVDTTTVLADEETVSIAVVMVVTIVEVDGPHSVSGDVGGILNRVMTEVMTSVVKDMTFSVGTWHMGRIEALLSDTLKFKVQHVSWLNCA